MSEVTAIIRQTTVGINQPVYKLTIRPAATIITGGGSGGVSSYNDLTDVPTEFPPEAHTHAIADVLLLQGELDGKAPSTHTHAISDVTGLSGALDGKADDAHTHAIADVTGLQGALDGKQADLGFTPEDAADKGVAGGYASLDGTGKVPAIQLPSPGSTDAVTEGATNKYFTTARVLATALTGFAASGTHTAVVATDTILQAFGKVQKYLSDLATVAFSGSASDLTAGTLPAARFDDTAHGSRSGGALHAAASGAAAGFMAAADKTKLDAITGTNSGDQTSIVGITGTKAQFDTAVTDGNFMYVGDAPTAHTHLLAAGATDVTITAANLNALDDGVNTVLHFHDADRARANHTGTQLAATISDFSEAVDDRVAALAVAGTNMTITYNDAAGTLTFDAAGGGAGTNLSYTAATRVIASDTGADATLPLVTSADAGLAPASGGGTTNFLRADGTWAAPSGGGGGSGDVVGPASATDNALARFDATTGKLIQNGGVTLDDDNAMTIPAVTAEPAAPPSGSMAFFATSRASQPWPAFKSPGSAEPHPLQPLIANGNYALFMPAVGTTVTNIGMAPATVGTATGLNVATGSRRGRMKRLAYRVTTSTTAIASWRNNAAQLTIGGTNAWEGGFWGVMHGGPDTGSTNASHRFFMGIGDTTAPSDVNPSTLLKIAGIGYDAEDTQVQFMHNDGTGAATKIALGASFPKPNADSSFAYRLRLYSPPGSTQSLSYEVENLGNGVIASGTVTTNLPAVTDFITPKMYTSVGGVSSVVGVMVGPIMFQTED